MSDLVGSCPLEIVNLNHPRGPFRCAVFDFDGTLSLLRGNWQGLMVPMMVETLAATGTGESPDELTAIVEEFVTRLTGQPTMQQMLALCDEVEKRGRPRPDPQVHLSRYLDMLLSRTVARIEDVQGGRATPDQMLVPGSRPLIERLMAGGFLLVIASGTELSEVRREADVLKIDHYFDSRIFGPVNNDVRFSKERVLRQLMAEHGLRGDKIAAIGDGPAEILAIKAVGGLAIGVASDEIHQDGRINRLKRDHLLRAGADVIIPDYRDVASILRLLTPDS
ncbi:MAG TPA: HAD family hydrolase [Pirellulaceae bacterium]|nr:HAD family hydrolase [Pirellulaceae bacterium]